MDMGTCRSIHHIFDSPPPEKNLSSLIESLSSSPLRNDNNGEHHHHSFTEIFGELHFKEIGREAQVMVDDDYNNNNNKWRNLSKFSSPYSHRRTESSDSLQLCTEGLGFESLDNVEDLTLDFHNTNNTTTGHQFQRSSTKYPLVNHFKEFPPPISSIGGGNVNNNNYYYVGKPWIFFQSYREEGRFILKEVRIPTQECLHASREDGRLRLFFVPHATKEEEEEEEDEEEREGDLFNGDEHEQEQEDALCQNIE